MTTYHICNLMYPVHGRTVRREQHKLTPPWPLRGHPEVGQTETPQHRGDVHPFCVQGGRQPLSATLYQVGPCLKSRLNKELISCGVSRVLTRAGADPHSRPSVRLGGCKKLSKMSRLAILNIGFKKSTFLQKSHGWGLFGEKGRSSFSSSDLPFPLGEEHFM